MFKKFITFCFIGTKTFMFKKIVWLWFSSTGKNAKDVKEYINSLVLWWATEFFTWYNPPYWHTKFGSDQFRRLDV